MKTLVTLTSILVAAATFAAAPSTTAAAQAKEKAKQEQAARKKAIGEIRDKLKGLGKKVAELRKVKKADEALAAANEAMALVKPYPTEWVLNQTAYGLLGSAYMANKDWKNAFEAYVKESENHNPHFGAPFNGLDAIVEVMRAGRCDEARAMLKRVYAIDKLDNRVLARAIDVEGRTYKVDKNWAGLKKLYLDTFADTNLCAKINDSMRLFDNYVNAYKESQQGYKAVWEVFDDALANPKKYGLEDAENQKRFVKAYADRTWKSLDHGRMKDARTRLAAMGLKPEDVGGMYASVLRYTDEMATFPKSEEELNIPTDAKTFLGFDPAKKVVHAKDFGWNPTNATECLQKALEADATTVVVDAMPSPWYIWNVKLTAEKGSNRKIVFAKGCTVLSAPEHGVKKTPGWYRDNMFDLAKCTNVWIEGEGTLGKDVYIGKYRNRAERLKVGWEYGGNGFGGSGCRRVVLKNLWVANCGQDALAWGGYDSYVIDCFFDDNYRQGLSLGGSSHCVYKNVTFANTFGGEPHCGIDFEPYYEIYLCAYQYFIDCKFYNNACKNVIFATSTYAPMTALFKRCQFEAQRNGNISVNARVGIYLNAGAHAPSNIIFDECRIDGYSDGHANPIQFGQSFFYDVTFRNCVINDKGRHGRDGDGKCSPIAVNLDRAVWDGYYPYPGVVTFENTKINGYEGVPIIDVADRNGKYCINSFRGSVIHNGKTVDLSAFDYQPPERRLQEASEADVKTLVAAPGTARIWRPAFDFGFNRNWYSPLPVYTMLCSGKTGEKATFTVDFGAISHKGDAVVVTRPDGQTVDVFQPQVGVNTFDYVFPQDGVYSFNLNIAEDFANRDRPKSGFRILSVTGTCPAWQAALNNLGRIAHLKTGDDYPAYTGYFEVPANKECSINLFEGGLDIRNAEGRSVVRVGPKDYRGTTCVTFTSKANEIWSFTTSGPAARMKFFAPLAGIWADDPESLPTYGTDLDFHRERRAGLAAAEMPKARLFALPIAGAVAKATEAAAARRAAFGATNDVVKAYAKARYHYDWMEPAMQTPEYLAMMDAELESLEPLRKRRDMQKAAGRESVDLCRYVAFVSLYAPVLGLADAEAKAWALKPGETDDAEALADATNAAITPYGVEWLEDGIYYDDYAGVVKLAPFIVDRLNELGANK